LANTIATHSPAHSTGNFGRPCDGAVVHPSRHFRLYGRRQSTASLTTFRRSNFNDQVNLAVCIAILISTALTSLSLWLMSRLSCRMGMGAIWELLYGKYGNWI